MTEGFKKVLDYLLPRLIILLCLPADYLGMFWLLGLAIGLSARAPSHSAPPIDKQFEVHPVLGALMVIAFFDTAVVRMFGLGALIVGIVLWIAYVALGTSLPKKMVTLVCLLVAIGGIYFAREFLHG